MEYNRIKVILRNDLAIDGAGALSRSKEGEE
jgi:hypothetical protein